MKADIITRADFECGQNLMQVIFAEILLVHVYC